MPRIAERLVIGQTAATESYPLTLRYGVVITVFVSDSDGTRNSEPSIFSDFDIDPCHLNSSVTFVIPDRRAGASGVTLSTTNETVV